MDAPSRSLINASALQRVVGRGRAQMSACLHCLLTVLCSAVQCCLPS
jgi:hypothetical protein